MLKQLCIGLVLTAAFSCSDTLVVSQYHTVDAGKWNADQPMDFTFSEIDSLSRYDMFITIRNDDSYPYSNLFLIAEMGLPGGQTTRDTLEYEMALPSGEWLGKGYGSIKENKLWYKENIILPVNGIYTLQISHAMRKNGASDGIQELQGITDVGFEIEKSK